MKSKLMSRRSLSLFLLLFVIGAGTLLGYRQLQPPAPPKESNPNHQAYTRMLNNVKTMAVEPRVPGSTAIEKTRAQIISQLQAMGIEPTVEAKTVTLEEIQAGEKQANSNGPVQQGSPTPQGVPTQHEGGATCTDASANSPCRDDAVYDKDNKVVLKNILVKLDAPNTDKAMLMAAHYDSDAESPGAADDMVSVAAMLEAIRKQADNKNLKNDLYFLFTDGEELGGMGAKAFVAAHPELQNSISHVVNLEARGSKGGLIMFETSARNYDLLRYFTSAASSPLAFSFSAELYKRMPNGTDLTSFLNAGYSGLNFAIAEGIEHYHHSSDSYENLNRGSAYQFLLTALNMTDEAANASFQDTRTQDGVYFPFLPGNIVIMTKTTAYGLAILSIVASVAWLILQIRRKKIRMSQVAIGSGWQVGTMIAIALLSWGITTVLTQQFGLGESDNTTRLFLAQATILTLATSALFVWRMRKQVLSEAVASLLPVQLLLITISTILLYSASYLFVLPTFILLIAALVEERAIARLVASTLGGLAILLLFVPVCWLLYVLFTIVASPLVFAMGVLPIAMLAALFTTRFASSKYSTAKGKLTKVF